MRAGGLRRDARCMRQLLGGQSVVVHKRQKNVCAREVAYEVGDLCYMRSHRSHCLMSISAINAVRALPRSSQGAHARQSSRALEVAFSYVRLNPEGRLQDPRFPPGVVHAVDDLRRVAFPREIGLHRNHDRSAESEQVAGANVPEGMRVISLIFFRAMMAQADLVLIVEPRLI